MKGNDAFGRLGGHGVCVHEELDRLIKLSH
jgi:hypothetical protein